MPDDASSFPTQLLAVARSGPDSVVRIVDLVLAEADRLAASDVHLRPTSTSLDVLFRIDGVLQPVAALPRDLAPNVIARLKVLAELLTYRTDIPQEGSIRPSPAGNRQSNAGGQPAPADRPPTPADRRLSTFPTVHGETAVIRVFNPAAVLLDLEGLGLPAPVLSGLDALLREPAGAIFLTGPSGSGKTTTIYACLRRLAAARPPRNIVTIEDPVERLLEGVSQSQARPGAEFDFARGLRSLLRQDPEVIMVGEVRDRETAAVAIEAALTGHLVISTIHTGSACGVVGRLLDMGVEPYLLTGGLKGVLNQRLLRRLCGDCKAPGAVAWRAVGCDRCGKTGYRGRLMLAELLTPTPELRSAILSRADTDALQAIAVRSGWTTIRDRATEALSAGETTKEEVERVLGPG